MILILLPKSKWSVMVTDISMNLTCRGIVSTLVEFSTRKISDFIGFELSEIKSI